MRNANPFILGGILFALTSFFSVLYLMLDSVWMIGFGAFGCVVVITIYVCADIGVAPPVEFAKPTFDDDDERGWRRMKAA